MALPTPFNALTHWYLRPAEDIIGDPHISIPPGPGDFSRTRDLPYCPPVTELWITVLQFDKRSSRMPVRVIHRDQGGRAVKHWPVGRRFEAD